MLVNRVQLWHFRTGKGKWLVLGRGGRHKCQSKWQCPMYCTESACSGEYHVKKANAVTERLKTRAFPQGWLQRPSNKSGNEKSLPCSTYMPLTSPIASKWCAPWFAFTCKPRTWLPPVQREDNSVYSLSHLTQILISDKIQALLLFQTPYGNADTPARATGTLKFSMWLQAGARGYLADMQGWLAGRLCAGWARLTLRPPTQAQVMPHSCMCDTSVTEQEQHLYESW